MSGSTTARFAGRKAGAPLFALLALGVAGCGHVVPSAYVDRRMKEPLRETPTPTSASTTSSSAAHPEPFDSASPARGYAQDRLHAGGAESRETPTPTPTPTRLADLLDLALSSDPATRAAWHEARAAAATAGARRGAWLPSLDASGVFKQEDAYEDVVPGVHPLTATASARLSWLLLDLGARGAAGQEAELNLVAARLAHEVAARDLALQVETTWFQYQASLALATASASSLAQAEASLAAAEARQRAGTATVADVLQARTARSQTRLEAQRIEGQVLALRGTLASLAGLPPTAELAAAPLPERLPGDLGLEEVGALLDEAARQNPDLARARAQAGAAEARATVAGRARLPTLSFAGSAGQLWPVRPEADPFTTWSAGVVLDVPLFDGGRTSYEAAAAREAAAAAQERAGQAGRRVQLDAWTSMQAVRTAGRRVETSRELLVSASAGAEVASARYREGVGSILDLLAAQSALAGARAEEILARADWLVAVARLARATGRALPSTDGASR